MKSVNLNLFAMILLMYFVAHTNTKKIIMIHPLYAGSHISMLRPLAEHLVSRGHEVYQLKFKSAGENNFKPSGVIDIDLKINDSLETCSDFINENGEFDITIRLAKYLWDHGDFGGFGDCFLRCHFETLFHDSELILQLTKSKFDVSIVDLKVS